MTRDELRHYIDDMQRKAWNATGEEKGARLREVTMLYTQLLGMGEPTSAVYEALTRIYTYLHEWEKAEEYARKMLDETPDSILAWHLLMEVKYGAGDYAAALYAVDQCIARDLASDYRYLFRARINRALGNLEEAAKDQQIYDAYEAAEKAKWDDPNHYYHYK